MTPDPDPAEPADYERHYATRCRGCGARLKDGVCPACGPENEVETKEGDTNERV